MGKTKKNTKKTRVVSGFPAVGKSFVFEKQRGGESVILDSDSSEFSWVKDSNGNNTEIRNPHFPNNYIKHIGDNLGVADIIFVSSHDVVQEALKENGIEYTIVYPDISLKEEWIERFKTRGNNEGFISFMSSNWEKFIGDIEKNNFHKKVKLQAGEFMTDVLEKI